MALGQTHGSPCRRSHSQRGKQHADPQFLCGTPSRGGGGRPTEEQMGHIRGMSPHEVTGGVIEGEAPVPQADGNTPRELVAQALVQRIS